MATKTNLGGVFMKDTDNNLASNSQISTENVCGIIFDTAKLGGLSEVLGTGVAAKTFANGAVVEFNTSNDIEAAGIDDTVMCGLVQYHLNMYFKLAGQNQRLFVSFMDSDTDDNYDAVELMQTAADGIIYQIGIWTLQPISKKNSEGKYEITSDTPLLSNLQAQAEVLGGKIGTINYDGNSPINVLVNAPVAAEPVIDRTKLPDLSSLNLPKVSYVLGQESAETVHAIQLALNAKAKVDYAMVGNIGALMACYSVALAHISIAYVTSFNLSSAMTTCELGCGDTTMNDEKTAWAATPSFNNLKSIVYSNRNTWLHQKGYIFLTTIDGIENGVFFSSDQTLSTADYRTVARCRVMHKSRRVVRQALLPFVNAPVSLDTDTGYMSSADITTYKNAVLNALDANLAGQISGRTCTIDSEQNVLENDKLDVQYSLIPIGCTSAIYVTEGFAATTATTTE